MIDEHCGRTRWLDLLENHGCDVTDDELMELISESTTMSKTLEVTWVLKEQLCLPTCAPIFVVFILLPCNHSRCAMHKLLILVSNPKKI